MTVKPTSSFDNLLSSLKAGKYSIVSPSEFLSQASLESVSVGKEKSSTSVVGKDMNVSDVCRSFGSNWMTPLEGRSRYIPVAIYLNVVWNAKTKNLTKSLNIAFLSQKRGTSFFPISQN